MELYELSMLHMIYFQFFYRVKINDYFSLNFDRKKRLKKPQFKQIIWFVCFFFLTTE